MSPNFLGIFFKYSTQSFETKIHKPVLQKKLFIVTATNIYKDFQTYPLTKFGEEMYSFHIPHCGT